MNDFAAQAIKVAASRTLLLAGFIVLLLGTATVADGMTNPLHAPRTVNGLLQATVGIVLIGLSRLVPRPEDDSKV